MRLQEWAGSSRPELAITTSFLILTIVFAETGSRILTYVSAAVTIACSLAIVVRLPEDAITIPNQIDTVLRIFMYLGITGLILTAYTTPTGVPATFYVLLLGVSVLLAVRISTNPDLKMLAPILLFAIAIRASYWYAAPVVGRDARFHIALTQYIIDTGSIVSSEITYYAFYPIGHLLPASLSQTIQVSPKVSVFLTIGFGAVVGIGVAAILTTRLVDLDADSQVRTILFAGLYLTIAPLHISASSELIVQSLMLIFAPISIYAFITREWWLRTLGVSITVVLLATHNIPGLFIIAFGAALIVANTLGEHLKLPVTNSHASYGLVAAISVGLAQYWVLVNIFDLQVYRGLRLFLPGGSIPQTTSSVRTPDLSLTDPLLMSSVGLLFAGLCIFASFLMLLRRFRNSNLDVRTDYFAAASLLFVFAGSTLVIGFNTGIIRLVPLAIVFAAPLVAYSLTKVSTRGLRGVAVVILLVAILPTFILISATGPGYSPGDAPTEDRPHSYRIYLSDSELAGAISASELTESITMGHYPKSSIAYRSGVQHTVPGINGINVMSTDNLTDCVGGHAFVRDYYETAFNITQQPTKNVVYTVGDAKIIEC